MGLPGMRGASMLMPVAYLKKWSERLYLWGGPPNPEVRRIFYHPPQAGDLNPMTAPGEWKPEPPEQIHENAVDIDRLSLAMQAELKRQLDEKQAEAAAPPQPKNTARVGRVTRFDPAEHNVTDVLAHLRTASPSEVDRVFAAESDGSKRAGVLKRRSEFVGTEVSMPDKQAKRGKRR